MHCNTIRDQWRLKDRVDDVKKGGKEWKCSPYLFLFLSLSLSVSPYEENLRALIQCVGYEFWCHSYWMYGSMNSLETRTLLEEGKLLPKNLEHTEGDRGREREREGERKREREDVNVHRGKNMRRGIGDMFHVTCDECIGVEWKVTCLFNLLFLLSSF